MSCCNSSVWQKTRSVAPLTHDLNFCQVSDLKLLNEGFWMSTRERKEYIARSRREAGRERSPNGLLLWRDD